MSRPQHSPPGLDVAYQQINDLSSRVTRHREEDDDRHKDHEMRIRQLEQGDIKTRTLLIVFSAVGSLVGSLIVAVLVRLIAKGGP